MRRTNTIKTISAVLLIGGLGLSACGSDSPSSEPSPDVMVTENAGETTGDGSTDQGSSDGAMSEESSGDDSSSDQGDSGMGTDGEWSYEDGDGGSYQVGGDVSVPADFPSDVPLPGGDWTLAATYVSDGDYLLTYNGEASEDACTSYFAEFAGWDEQMRSSADGTFTAVYGNDTWTVILGCDPSSGLSVQASMNAG